VQSLAVNGYTAADVLYALRGIRGRREWRFRYELLSSANVLVRQLTNVAAGHVEQDFLAEIKRTAKFTIQDRGDINFLTQRIKPWAGIKMSDGGYAEWPLGVFLMTTPTRKADISGVVTRDIDAYDATMVLQEDTVSGRYYVGNNQNIIAAVIEVLTNTPGIVSWNIPANAAVTTTAIEWEPGTTKYQIIADLLGRVNYTSLWFDGNGVARAIPYVIPSSRTSEFEYATDVRSVILPDIEQTLDLYRVPNRWVLIVSNPETTPLRAEITNTDPSSPTSTVNRGRTITRVITDEDVPTQGLLNAKAERYREEDGNIFESVEFATGLMPFHDSNDVYDLVHDDLAITGKWNETKWAFDLLQGAGMTHSIRRTVSV